MCWTTQSKLHSRVISTDTIPVRGDERFVLEALQVSVLCKSSLVRGSITKVFETLLGSTFSVDDIDWPLLEKVPSSNLSPSHQDTLGVGEPPSARHVSRRDAPSTKGPTIESISAPSAVIIDNFFGGTAESESVHYYRISFRISPKID